MLHFTLLSLFRYYLNSILKSISCTKREVYIRRFNLSVTEFQQIVKESSHVDKLKLEKCKFEFLNSLDFSTVSNSKIKQLCLYQCGNRGGLNYTFSFNFTELECVVEAIAKSSIRLSLRLLKVQSSELDKNKVKEILDKHGLERVKGVIKI